MEEVKKLSRNIKKTKVVWKIPSRCFYEYTFQTQQFLESIDSYEYFGISDDSIKQVVIDDLVMKFRHDLNSLIFGDPAGNFPKEE